MRMTRESYMRELEHLLAKVPEKTRREWLYDYYQHFQQAQENGQAEEEAAMELGDPKMIANELLFGYRIEQAETTNSFGKLSKSVFATAGLGLFNIVFVLGPYIAIAAVLVSLWAVAASLALAGVAVIVDCVWVQTFTMAQATSLALIFFALALLLGIALKALTKGYFNMTLKYLKFNTRMIKGNK